MYVERTSYYAKAGQREAVLATRRQASEIRRCLGLSAGAIRVKADDGAGPDVEWECAYPDRAANKADMRARAESAEFEAVRARMTALVERFERRLIRDDRGDGLGQASVAGAAILPERVTFASAGRQLAGFLFLPPGEGPFPCMVANHGSTVAQGSTDICKPSVASLLMSWGVACFFPNRRGYGESPGPAWREEVPAAFGSEDYDAQLAARLDAESDDVTAALAFLDGRPEIAPDRVGVMGSSFGGVNTLLAAAKAPEFRCAVEFAGGAMNWERTPRLRDLMHVAAERLIRPIFLIQAENDYSTAPTRELAGALAERGQAHQAKVYPPFGVTKDEGHLFERHGLLVWGPDVRAFLDRWL